MITISVTPDKTLKNLLTELLQFTNNTNTQMETKTCYRNDREYTTVIEITGENLKVAFEEYDKKTLKLEPKTEKIDKIIMLFTPIEKTLYIVTDNKKIKMAQDFFYIDYYENVFWIGEYYAHNFTYTEYINKKTKIKTYTRKHSKTPTTAK